MRIRTWNEYGSVEQIRNAIFDSWFKYRERAEL